MAKKIRKTKRRTAKKKTVKRKIVRKKTTAKKTRKKQKTKKKKLTPDPIGRVTHYFPKAEATAVLIKRGQINIGDTLYYKGHTTNFKQRVDSLQINRQPVTKAGKGDEVGIEVKSRTREHDLVFKV